MSTMVLLVEEQEDGSINLRVPRAVWAALFGLLGLTTGTLVRHEIALQRVADLEEAVSEQVTQQDLEGLANDLHGIVLERLEGMQEAFVPRIELDASVGARIDRLEDRMDRRLATIEDLIRGT